MRSCHYLILAVLLAIISVSSVQAETSLELADKAEQLHSEEKYEEALETIEKAIDLDPELFNLYYTKAELLDHLERYEDEVAAIDKGLAFDSENADMLTSKAIALKKLERYEEAAETFETATLLYQKRLKNCGIPAGTTN